MWLSELSWALDVVKHELWGALSLSCEIRGLFLLPEERYPKLLINKLAEPDNAGGSYKIEIYGSLVSKFGTW